MSGNTYPVKIRPGLFSSRGEAFKVNAKLLGENTLLTFDTSVQHPVRLSDFAGWIHGRATSGYVKQILICSVKSNGGMGRDQGRTLISPHNDRSNNFFKSMH